MSSERSNSAVRNLRSIFENKASENSPNPRGRSPGSLGGELDSQHRPTPKVRSSFIPVEPTMAVLAAEQDATENELTRTTSMDKRRTSFNEGQTGEAIDKMKETVSNEQERRDQDSSVAETIPEGAIESALPIPAVEAIKELGSAAPEEKEAANPDKPVTGAEEEPARMKPADPASESAVSGGEALPPVAEDLRKTIKSGKPSAISTKSAKPAPSSVKSPKTSVSTSSAALGKKPSRSSLTAPTAASVARQAAADKQAAAAAAPKPKPREVTKPLEVSSRLTAPTAASRARLESATSAQAPTAKPTAASKAKATGSARPTPRQSLAGRPDSRASQKPVAPVDGSFLERMTRPTAASANRIHEKTEVKSPPRQKQLPTRPKTNGVAKTKSSTSATAGVAAESEGDVTTVEDASILPEDEPAEAAAEAEPEEPEKASEPTGNETPVPDTNGHQEEALESTPAAMGSEEAIR